MHSKLTPEQREAIAAQPGVPIPVFDDQGEKFYYLIEESSLRHLEGIAGEQSQKSLAQLRELIQDGIDSPDVPANIVYAELRKKAAEASQTNA